MRARDTARGHDGVGQCGLVELIRVRETRALAGDRAHADALVDAVGTFLDDAVLDGPGLVARELQVQIDVVELAHHRSRERALERRELEAGAFEQQLACNRERVSGSHYGLRRCRHESVSLELAPMLNGGKALAQILQPDHIEIGANHTRT